MMNFEVRVVPPNVFRAYMDYRIANPNATNADAMVKVGLPARAVTTKPFETRRGQQSNAPQQ
jgi:cytochrome c oxidase subunit 2